jgi:GNAT superfamily N-acetyltransferase
MLEVHAVHVAGRPDLFKPAGVERAPQIEARMSDAHQFYWVASLGNRIIGYAYARYVDESESVWRHSARVVVLDQMGVESRYRSRGVGERLWDAVREMAVSERADRVVLNVWAFNVDARRFYERLGFAPFHERMSVELGDSKG